MPKIIRLFRDARKLTIGAALLLCGLSSYAALNSSPTLEYNQGQAEAMWANPLKDRLVKSGVVRYELKCVAETHTIEGTFYFYPVEGRKPQRVVGNSACDKAGPILSWEMLDPLYSKTWQFFNEVKVAKSFVAENIQGIDVTNGLLDLGKVVANSGMRERKDLSEVLSDRHYPLIQGRMLAEAHVYCDQDGGHYMAHFRYVGYGMAVAELNSRCEKAGQNFTLQGFKYNWYKPESEPYKLVSLQIKEYAPVTLAEVDSVYAELTPASL